jgi:hypothetical protein
MSVVLFESVTGATDRCTAALAEATTAAVEFPPARSQDVLGEIPREETPQ